MTDYLMGVRNGTMMIRDTGGWVEFWFQTGSSTWNNQQTWGYQANGQYIEQTYRLAQGGGWQNFGSVYVTDAQDVLFRIFGAGLGWGTTDFWQHIDRGRVPDPPAAPTFSEIGQNSVRVRFDWGYDGAPSLGGLPVLEAQIGIAGPGPNQGWYSGNNLVFYGLYSGVEYLFFGRLRNEKGWSKAGAQARVRTLSVPNAPNPPRLYPINPARFIAMLDDRPYDGGTPIREMQIAYGTDPNTAQTYVSDIKADATGLVPGGTYYIWARVRNDIGWSPWSIRQTLVLPAGVLVDVGGEYKRALPWIKVDGVWRLSIPLVNYGGIWRATS